MIEIGKKVYPVKRSPRVTDTYFEGAGWNVEQKDNRYFLRFIDAGHGGGIVTGEITEAEYLDLRSGNTDLTTVIRAHGLG